MLPGGLPVPDENHRAFDCPLITVDPTQTETFLRALKQSRFYVRKIDVPTAPHFWMADPVEATNSFPGFLAPRLLRFLADRL